MGREDGVGADRLHGSSTVPGGAAGALDGRCAPVAGAPAAGVPVPAVGQVAAFVGRPDDEVLDAGPDLLVAAGAAVRLVARGHLAYQPFPIGMGLDGLDTTAYPVPVDRGL